MLWRRIDILSAILALALTYGTLMRANDFGRRWPSGATWDLPLLAHIALSKPFNRPSLPCALVDVASASAQTARGDLQEDADGLAVGLCWDDCAEAAREAKGRWVRAAQ